MQNKKIIINLILLITNIIVTIVFFKITIPQLSDPSSIGNISNMIILIYISMFTTFILLCALLFNMFCFFKSKIELNNNNTSQK